MLNVVQYNPCVVGPLANVIKFNTLHVNNSLGISSNALPNAPIRPGGVAIDGHSKDEVTVKRAVFI